MTEPDTMNDAELRKYLVDGEAADAAIRDRALVLAIESHRGMGGPKAIARTAREFLKFLSDGDYE